MKLDVVMRQEHRAGEKATRSPEMCGKAALLMAALSATSNNARRPTRDQREKRGCAETSMPLSVERECRRWGPDIARAVLSET